MRIMNSRKIAHLWIIIGMKSRCAVCVCVCVMNSRKFLKWILFEPAANSGCSFGHWKKETREKRVEHKGEKF